MDPASHREEETHTVPLPKTITLESFQVMPQSKPEEYAALKISIRERGRVQYAVHLDANFSVIDGHHRLKAYFELLEEGYRVERPRAVIHHELTSDVEKRALARELNRTSRTLSDSQKRAVVREQLLDTPRWSDSRVAVASGVSQKLVTRIREGLEAAGEIPFYGYLEAVGGRLQRRFKGDGAAARLKATAEHISLRKKGAADEQTEDLPLPVSARGSLASKAQQSPEARKERKLKSALRKTIFALNELAGATDFDPEEVAARAEGTEAKMLYSVYEHSSEWLEMFILSLQEDEGEEQERS